nr:unnamed protein product [Spirometra erinaceieuropaei]
MRRTPTHPDQHLLPPPDAREGHLDVSSVTTLAPAGLCPRPEARTACVLVTKVIPGADGCVAVRVSSLSAFVTLSSIASSSARCGFSHSLTEDPKLTSLLIPDAAAVADENASVENLWCQLRDKVQSTALAVLGRACRQHHYWFDDNYAAISNLLAEENRLHKVYVKRPTDDNKAAFYRSHRLAK